MIGKGRWAVHSPALILVASLLMPVLASACGAGRSGVAAGGDITSAPSGTQLSPEVSTSSTATVPSSAPRSSTTSPGGSGRPASSGSPVAGFDALGPARIGMRLSEFARSLGHRATPSAPGEGTDGCWTRAFSGLPGVTAMVLGSADGPVRRVDVWTPSIRTVQGIGVGSTEDDVRAAFPRAVRTEPDKYLEGGHDLRVQSGQFRMLFEADARHRVTRFRFGQTEQVSLVEGCS